MHTHTHTHTHTPIWTTYTPELTNANTHTYSYTLKIEKCAITNIPNFKQIEGTKTHVLSVVKISWAI